MSVNRILWGQRPHWRGLRILFMFGFIVDFVSHLTRVSFCTVFSASMDVLISIFVKRGERERTFRDRLSQKRLENLQEAPRVAKSSECHALLIILKLYRILLYCYSIRVSGISRNKVVCDRGFGRDFLFQILVGYLFSHLDPQW